MVQTREAFYLAPEPSANEAEILPVTNLTGKHAGTLKFEGIVLGRMERDGILAQTHAGTLFQIKKFRPGFPGLDFLSQIRTPDLDFLLRKNVSAC